MVNLSLIGESSEGLICLTPCCGPHVTFFEPQHNWILPNGRNATKSEGQSAFVFERPHSLILNRPNGVELPTGIYTCTLPDLNSKKTMLNIMGYERILPGKTCG